LKHNKTGIDPFANQADLLNQVDQEDSELKKKKKEKTEKINADSVQDKYIHIRTQQRNGRKSLTTLQGINPKINKKIILKECKKKFNCNGTLVEDSELGDIIQLQGDQRKNVAQFLIDEKISKKEFIKVHGS
jgi:translation initiation factor 1